MSEQNNPVSTNKNFFVIKTEPSVTDITPKDPLVENFKKDLRDAEFFELDETIVNEFKKGGYLPENIGGSEIASAFQLYARGVKSINLAEDAKRIAFLKEGERESLYNTAYLIEVLEAAEIPEIPASQIIYTSNFKPQATYYESAFATAPQENQISFERKGSFLDPVLSEIKGRASDYARGKLKDVAKKAIEKGGEKLLKEGSKVALKTGIKLTGKATITAAAQAAGTTIPIIGNAIAFIATEVLPKVLNFFKNIFSGALRFLTGEKDIRKQIMLISGALAAIFLGLGQAVPAAAAGLVSLGAGASIVGGYAIGSGVAGVFQSFIYGVTAVVIPAAVIPTIITILAIPIVVALILFIINTGAYITPRGGFSISERIGPVPIGGAVSYCDPVKSGPDITQEMAGRITGGVVNLLPPTNSAMAFEYCITPTMIILHSSLGYDNNDGNLRTYETLISGNVACQLASDTDDVWLMQHFYENQVQFAWCANSWNTFGISIEIAGECQDGCVKNYSACQVGTGSPPYTFSNPPPHPCPNETDLTIDALCEVMDQYNIPVSQIFTHDDVPDASHTDPVGKEYVNNYLIPRIRSACPHPEN